MTLHPRQVFEVRKTEMGSLKLLFGSGLWPCFLSTVSRSVQARSDSCVCADEKLQECSVWFLVRFQLGERSSLLSDETDEYKVFQTFALRFLKKNHSS